MERKYRTLWIGYWPRCNAKVPILSQITDTISSCCEGKWCQIITAYPRPPSKNSCRESSLWTRNEIATSYATNDKDCFVGHLLYRLYRIEITNKSFIPSYENSFYQHGEKKNNEWGFWSRYRIIDAVYIVRGRNSRTCTLMVTLYATVRLR